MQQFIDNLRRDLTALCCAGAFVSLPNVWPEFIEWVKSNDPAGAAALGADTDKYAQLMMEAVMRIDRVAMTTLLLNVPTDQEIQEMTEGKTDDT
jgi:hypothetical protein